MTDNLKGKAKKSVNDGRITVHPVSDNVKNGDPKPDSGDSKAYPQDRNSEVNISISQEKLTCPQCGKSTIHAEFPDHYEAWIKCSSCGFFMGMSKDEWHSMENSPNLNEKIKKMAKKLKILEL
jgi:ribosomal protein S27AE